MFINYSNHIVPTPHNASGPALLFNEIYAALQNPQDELELRRCRRLLDDMGCLGVMVDETTPSNVKAALEVMERLTGKKCMYVIDDVI